MIATAPQVDGHWALNQVRHRTPVSIQYTDIDNNNTSQLALKTTGHASRRNAEKRMSWHRHMAHVSQMAFEILPTITDTSKITEKCD
jgi:hypothetical protein